MKRKLIALTVIVALTFGLYSFSSYGTQAPETCTNSNGNITITITKTWYGYTVDVVQELPPASNSTWHIGSFAEACAYYGASANQ